MALKMPSSQTPYGDYAFFVSPLMSLNGVYCIEVMYFAGVPFEVFMRTSTRFSVSTGGTRYVTNSQRLLQ
jgi:DUF1365 family protein